MPTRQLEAATHPRRGLFLLPEGGRGMLEPPSTTDHVRLVADCPYCSAAYLVEGPVSLWVHLAIAHPKTPVGGFIASMLGSLEPSA